MRLDGDAERADEVIRSHLMENEMKRLEIEMRLRAEAEHDDEQLRQKRLRDDDRWNECSFQRLAKKPRGMMVSMEKLRALRDFGTSDQQKILASIIKS